MNDTKMEGSTPNLGAGNMTAKVTIAAIWGAVLVTLIMAGCTLTALIMVLDAIPWRHIFVP